MKKLANLIFIVLLGVLSLQPLVAATPVQAATTPNLIANASVDTVDPANTAQPQDWQHSAWGTNTTTYSYLTTGHTGRSVKVTTSKYTDGDAKWYFAPVTVAPSTTYVYSDYYKSTIWTDIVAEVHHADGSTSYLYLGSDAPSTTWKLAGYKFATPADVTQVTVLHVLAGVGNLQTDDSSLQVDQPATITAGVPNNSLEDTSPLDTKSPLAWQHNAWGTNTATFAYTTTGHTGSHSAKVTMSSYTSGEAKWFFDAQPVTPGQLYLFGDWYKSGVATNVTAEITMTDGSTKYIDMGNLPKSATVWKQGFLTFVAPVGAVRATVYHQLAAVGSLQTDDFSLTPVVSPVITNGIANSTMEQVSYTNPNAPMAWTSAGWGTNTRTFSYPTTAHTGSHSARVDVTKYTDGDAKWMFDAQPVTAGLAYNFSDYYESNVDTHVVAQINLSNGTIQYLQLPAAPASATTWANYSTKFFAPVGATSVTVFHLISSVGFLQTDDYSLLSSPTVPFSRGLVSLTFDDGWDSIYTNGLPILQAHNMVSTQFIATGLVGTPGYMTVPQIAAFQTAGHEIGSHTVSHPDLTTLTTVDLISELSGSKAFLETNGFGPITDFASPYGAYNPTVISAIKTYYASHRSVDMGFNSKDNFDAYNLKVQDIGIDTTTTQVAAWATQAAADRTWLILVYHQVDTSGDAYSVTPTNLNAQLTAVAASGLPAVTIRQGLAEVTPQL
jgi:peptidoglycan/xylan/chitin deacetylase (PgdA/CDA1 family)